MSHPSRKHIPMVELIPIRRAERMDRIDAMPDDLRAMVHEYGLNIVDTCVGLGVTKPRQIRHLVETITGDMSAVKGSFSAQGSQTRRPPKGWVLVPAEPTDAMIDAAIQTLADWRAGLSSDERVIHSVVVHGRLRTYMDKREKHRARYKQMLAVAPRSPDAETNGSSKSLDPNGSNL